MAAPLVPIVVQDVNNQAQLPVQQPAIEIEALGAIQVVPAEMRNLQDSQRILTSVGAVSIILMGILIHLLLVIWSCDSKGPNPLLMKIARTTLILSLTFCFAALVFTGILASLPLRIVVLDRVIIRRVFVLARIPTTLVITAVAGLVIASHMWLWASYRSIFAFVITTTLIGISLFTYVFSGIRPFAFLFRD